MLVEGTRRFRTQYTRDVSSTRLPVSGGLSTSSFFPGSPDAPINQSISPKSTMNSNTSPAQSSLPPITTTPTSLGTSSSRVSPSAPPTLSTGASLSTSSTGASRTPNGTVTQLPTSGLSLGASNGSARGQNTSASYSSTNPATLASDSSASRGSYPTTSTSKPISTQLIIALAAAAGLLIIGIPLIIVLVRRKRKRNLTSKAAAEKSKLPPPPSITTITRQTPSPSGSPSTFPKRALMTAAAIPFRNARDTVGSFGPGPRPPSQNLWPPSEASRDMEYMRPANVATPVRRVYRPNPRAPVRRTPSPDRSASNAQTNEPSDIPISYNSQRNRQQANDGRRPYELPTGPRSTRRPSLLSEFTSPRRAPRPLNPQPTRIIDAAPQNKQYTSDLASNPFSPRSSYYNDEFPRTPTSAIMAAQRSSVGSATDSQVSGFYANDDQDSAFEEYNNDSQSYTSSGRRPLTSMDPDYPIDFSYYETRR